MLHPVDTYQYHFVASIMQKRYRPTWHSCAADAANLVNPPPGNPETDHGIVPSRFDHALICGPDIQNVPVLFVNALGFYLTEQVLLEYGQTQLDHFPVVHEQGTRPCPRPPRGAGKLHHVSFLLESWERVLRAADLMSMSRIPIDIGPTRHGITRGCTIYAFDPSGNRFETLCGGYQPYPNCDPLIWTWDEVGTAIFDHDRALDERFLEAVT